MAASFPVASTNLQAASAFGPIDPAGRQLQDAAWLGRGHDAAKAIPIASHGPPPLQRKPLRLADKVVDPELWDVLDDHEAEKVCPTLWERQGPEDNRLFLKRAVASGISTPPTPTGFLRPWEHWRQTLLVARRQKAIEALPQHAYLLRALLRPDLMRIDTGLVRLPLGIDEGVKESERLDDAKKLALRRIWQTRPLFTLQGPPGTGKTTLVTALLRQIFHEDRNAQVLVTAQAHTAVDTLRERVRRAYQDVPEEQHPLAIRLKMKGTSVDNQRDEDYPEQVAARLLDRAYEHLNVRAPASGVQKKWLDVVKRLRHVDGGSRADPDASPFLELLRRAANITYCTSTAGDLSVLATRTQSFDWCIVEEAAKAHGHDLVLPLQLGYRWLLIGDHYQLKPYRYRDFLDAIANLPAVMQRLRRLMESGSRLVDRGLVQQWYREQKDDGKLSLEQEKLQTTSSDWLRFFERLFKACDAIAETENEHYAEGKAPIAQVLDQQHRMHPVIAGLVSKAFYESQNPPRPIRSMTGDTENPKPRVRHAFVAPAGIADKSIVWVNVPERSSCTEPPGRTEEGFWSSAVEAEAVERFLNSLHVDPDLEHRLYSNDENPDDLRALKLAVLSPYRKQVYSEPLRRGVRRIYAKKPSWLRIPEDPTRIRPRTVDSYQGNEAAIVTISLVRNNAEENPSFALGFLQEMDRMNVMFSRAERLLVLVGCWEFFVSVAQRLRQGRSLQEWPLVVNYLTEAFEKNKAVRFELSDLPPLSEPNRRTS